MGNAARSPNRSARREQTRTASARVESGRGESARVESDGVESDGVESASITPTRVEPDDTAPTGPVPSDERHQAGDSQVRLRLWLRLLRATRKVENELRERLRTRADTTLPRFDVLAALHRRPDGITMSGLSRMLMVSNGNVTGLIDRLVDDGLVHRRPVEGDRRSVEVALTDEGLAWFEAVAHEHEGWVDEILDSVSADEAQALFAPLERLAGMGKRPGMGEKR